MIFVALPFQATTQTTLFFEELYLYTVDGYGLLGLDGLADDPGTRRRNVSAPKRVEAHLPGFQRCLAQGGPGFQELSGLNG